MPFTRSIVRTSTRSLRLLPHFLFLMAASCGEDATGTGESPFGTAEVASVAVTPASLTLFVGGRTQLSVVVKDANGNTVAAGSVTWSSSDASVASVSAAGLVTAISQGSATITAAVSGASGSASIQVQSTPQGSGDVVVNAGVTFQTMRGWEAHAQSGHEHPDYAMFRSQLLDRAVDELGINRVRLEIWSGQERDVDLYTQWLTGQIDDATWRCERFATVNDNGDPNVIDWSGFTFAQLDSLVNRVVLPLQQRLQARGERLHVNLDYVAGTSQICGGDRYVHDDDPEEYAEFVLAHFIHLDGLGVHPVSFELINEPNSTRWASKGALLGRALIATKARLNSAGYFPRFVGPSVSQARFVEGYLAQISQTPGAVTLIDEVAYHRYDRPSDAMVADVARQAAAIGAETSMLEFWRGADQYTLYSDLVFGNVSAWEQFALAFFQTRPINDVGGTYYIIDVTTPGNPQLILSQRARYLSQYFKYVREGDQRVQATSSAGGVLPVAFVRPNGKMAVVANVDGPKSFTVGGLAGGTYDITYTTSSELQANAGSVTISSGQQVSLSVPSRGVVTIYAR